MRTYYYLLTTKAAIINLVSSSPLEFVWPIFDVGYSFLVDCCRLFCSRKCAYNLEQCKRPERQIVLYQYEGCPFCRKVRETMSVLGIDHLVLPCPRETVKKSGVCVNSRYKPEVLKLGGRLSFPFIHDENTGKSMNESSMIEEYLWKEYGSEAKPRLSYTLSRNPTLFRLSMLLIPFLRPCMNMGYLRIPSKKPKKPLEFWGFESSCLARRVRELLDCLELPYIYHQVPLNYKAKEKDFEKRFGNRIPFFKLRTFLRLPVTPVLEDPNTDTELFCTLKMINYLKETYQTAPCPKESWSDTGCLERTD